MKKFAILAEDRSDSESLVVLVKRLLEKENASVPQKGFSGCGELCRKAWSHIVNFADQGVTHFIICHDADKNSVAEVKQKVRDEIGGKIALTDYNHAIIVPVEELEAWIIADEEAISKVIPTLKIKAQFQPETIKSPKEWLKRESQRGRSTPLYVPTAHNPKVAAYLNIDKVFAKCKSFREFHDFVKPPQDKQAN